MTHPLPAALRGLALATCVAMTLAGCKPGDATSPSTIKVASSARLRAATRPVDAAYVLRDRLLERDGRGFARLAVPPELHARLADAWLHGQSRWPLDELPLDARLPAMLAALQADGAQARLMTTFNQQFAGADADIDQAIRTLVLFGGEYVQKEAGYTPEEREHVAQAIEALGDWALQAPFADPARAEPFFSALVAAARRCHVDGAAGEAAYAALGMDATLDRLSPFVATMLGQLRQQYGLDIDASLRGLQVELLQQAGDSARLRLRYPLGRRQVDAIVPAVRIDGHWYLADYVRRAGQSLPPTG